MIHALTIEIIMIMVIMRVMHMWLSCWCFLLMIQICWGGKNLRVWIS